MKTFFSLCCILLFLNDVQSQVTDVVTGLSGTARLLVDNDDLYYTHQDKITKLNITDTLAYPVDLVTGLTNPIGLAIKDETLYFSEFSAGRISKIVLTDSVPIATDFVTGLQTPNMLLIDGSFLYFTDNNSEKLFKLDITQSNPSPIEVVSGGLPYAIGLALNDNDLYISSGIGLSGKIDKIDITENTPALVTVMEGINHPLGIGLKGENLYIAEFYGDKISKINITDSIPVLVDTIMGLDNPKDVAFHGGSVYILESTKISKTEGLVIAIDEVGLANSYGIFPNPSSDFIRVLNAYHKLNYRIFDIVGREMLVGSILPNESINIKSLNDGIYILNLDNEMNIKFIKK